MKAYRKNGKLLIEIDEEALCNGDYTIPGNNPATVTDREKFLNFCVKNICIFGPPSTGINVAVILKLLDDLVSDAIFYKAGIK
jgi:hypothetical protein